MRAVLELAQFAPDVANSITAVLPNPDATQTPNTEGLVTIMGWLKWIALAVCIAALIAGAVVIGAIKNEILNPRGEVTKSVQRIAMPLVAVVIVTAATSLIGFLVTA